jgi:hypothetical protein
MGVDLRWVHRQRENRSKCVRVGGRVNERCKMQENTVCSLKGKKGIISKLIGFVIGNFSEMALLY